MHIMARINAYEYLQQNIGIPNKFRMKTNHLSQEYDIDLDAIYESLWKTPDS